MEDIRIADREEQRGEAVFRLQTIIDEFGANPNILKYFNEGKVYYSYATMGGCIGSIDTVSYDKRYEEAVKEVEKEYGCLVYHVVEFADTLFMLHVDKYADDWEASRLDENNTISSISYNLNTHYTEIGYIPIYVYQGAVLFDISAY